MSRPVQGNRRQRIQPLFHPPGDDDKRFPFQVRYVTADSWKGFILSGDGIARRGCSAIQRSFNSVDRSGSRSRSSMRCQQKPFSFFFRTVQMVIQSVNNIVRKFFPFFVRHFFCNFSNYVLYGRRGVKREILRNPFQEVFPYRMFSKYALHVAKMIFLKTVHKKRGNVMS